MGRSVVTMVDYDITDFVSDVYKVDLELFMSHMANPTVRSHFGEVAHYFLGSMLDPKPRPQDHITCLAPKADIEFAVMKRMILDVTLVKEHVTCAECLDWMHA